MSLTYTKANALLTEMLCLYNDTVTKECYIGLSSTTPDANGGNFTEPDQAQTGYRRALIGSTSVASSRKMGTPSSGAVTNSLDVQFPYANANYGDPITYFGLFDSNSAQNPFFTGQLTNSINVLADSIPIFPVGAIRISIT